MSLEKSIAHGKEHRKPYRGAKAIDHTCRNHGSCGWCSGNRTHKNDKRELIAENKLEEYEMNRRVEPGLKEYVARYRMDKELLQKYPENKDLLERRIKEHETAIIGYVTSDSFQTQLNYLNL